MEEKNKTGYPHIDKPWMKYYEGKNIDIKQPNTNIMDYIKSYNVNRGNYTAETYYGNKITYNKLFEKSDEASKAFSSLGVKKGNIILNLLPTIPEAGQIWLGASQIGAVADFVDPRPDSMNLLANAQKILELIKYEHADYIVALDKCYTYMLKPIEKQLKDIGMKNVIIVSASDSMNLIGIISYLKDVIMYNKLKNDREINEVVKKLKFYEALLEKIQVMSKDKQDLKDAIKSSPIEVIKYKDLVSQTKNSTFDEIKDSSLVSYVGHTSGTSGARPKPIPLTNKNLINSTEQTFAGGYGVCEKDRVIHELPFFSPLGACNNYLIDLISGANLIDVPEFEINEFGYLIKKYKPNGFMGTPAWLASLPSCKYLDKINLSKVNKVIYGGDSMTTNDEKKLNGWLKEHGCKVVTEKGHGMSEYCGGGTYAIGEWNKYESIGIPFPHTIYGIVDPDVEDKLVPINTPNDDGYLCGELVVSTDALTSGIFNGIEVVKHYEMDGRSYIRTRDMVKMDKNGIFYFESRKDRSFTRYDGYKIKPAEIEKEIEKSNYVKYCRIVNYYDEKQRGFMPIAHIVLNDDAITDANIEYSDIVEDIINNQIISNPIMSSRQIPSKFKFRESLPLTKNSKINYNALIQEELDGTEINVEIQETNMSVNSIKVYRNGEKVLKKL